MINKKICKLLGPILGVMGFMLSIGILEVPVLGADNVQVTSAYTSITTSAAVTYTDYSVNVNKSVTQNGLKVTLEKAVATKHKLRAEIKVESTQPFDQTKNNNSIFQLLYGEDDLGGQGMSSSYIDDKTLLITIEQDNNDKEFPEKGDLRLDVVFPYYKVTIGMDASVDFSEAFNNELNEDISTNLPESNYVLNKLDSDVLGTTITYSGPREDHTDRSIDSSIILKAGNKMYKLRASGSSSDDKGVKGTYESKAATYDVLKDQKDISVIPLICNMTWDEFRKTHEDNYKKNDANRETLNNVSYLKSFDFSDGSKGEIYNIERNDNSVKVYCRGNSEKASLLMASNMDMYYKFVEGQTNYVNYESDKYMSFYKDPNDALGYIVEFDNLDKTKALELNFNPTIKQIDRYNLNKEIQISK
ncbi:MULTISPECIES: DUF4179 domain-containing protein [unclassified Clostridium]|uniref:DUF4179 domain-containing protein n=1 Tax=unclassified Clostridium TaxID=2614128 RepID=UPI0002982F1C|nr:MULTISPECIES: DUF4179 domain-containing protein [unclassified Clostridium]EKQ57361.1 MAG: hypothetical protein A370_01012 [Clostridium sp. Maddingley MBC34-26]